MHRFPLNKSTVGNTGYRGRYALNAMKNLNCPPSSCVGKIDARVVKKLSKRFKLDPSYLDCLSVCHGGEPQLNTIQLATDRLTLAFFLTMLDGKSRLPGGFQPHFAYPTVDARVINSVGCIMDSDSNTSRCLFGKLVPFAATQKDMCLDGGYVDLFCFDYRQTLDPPPIVLWVAHCAMDAYFDWDDLPFEDKFDDTGCCANVPWDRFLKPIAGSFSEFVLMLEQGQ